MVFFLNLLIVAYYCEFDLVECGLIKAYKVQINFLGIVLDLHIWSDELAIKPLGNGEFNNLI